MNGQDEYQICNSPIHHGDLYFSLYMDNISFRTIVLVMIHVFYMSSVQIVVRLKVRTLGRQWWL